MRKGRAEDGSGGEKRNQMLSVNLVSPHTECPYKGLEVACVDAANRAITFLQAKHQNC